METTLPLAFCRRKGHVTFAMVPIALGLGTGRSASVADLAVHALLAACVGRQQFLRVRESALAALETAQAAKWAARPEPLLSKRWIGEPRYAPRKVDPRIPPEPSHCPRWLVRPLLQLRPRRRRQVTCRIRSVPEIHHANLHPSSIVRGRHIPGGSQHQQKKDHGEGEPRTGSASSVDALFPRSLPGGCSPDNTTIRG